MEIRNEVDLEAFESCRVFFICDGESAAVHVCYIYGWGERILEITFWRKGMKRKNFPPSVNCFILKSCCSTYAAGRIRKFWILLFATHFAIFSLTCLFFLLEIIIKRD